MLEQDSSTNQLEQQGEVILSVHNVSKRFCRDLKRSLFYGMQDIASEVVGLRREGKTLRPKEFWALNDVSFQLRRGEALGLVGKNGSGKSTILRIIAGLIKPDIGSVEVKGRVAPLIALGAGFNPILTGRENIYANMSILGLSKQEIDDRFDEVVEFAEIGDAIDSPVQSYSSGMAARLGFSTAIHTNPDILLIDEVLAVGDIKFQSKCYRRLDELKRKAVSFILVAHNPEAIYATCTSAVYLLRGNLIAQGDVSPVMRRYEEELYKSETDEQAQGEFSITKKAKDESAGLDIISVHFQDKNEKKILQPVSGEFTRICINCYAHASYDEIGLRVRIQKQGHGGDFLFMNNLHDKQPLKVKEGDNSIYLDFPYLGLMPGNYTLIVVLLQGQLHQFDVSSPINFKVEMHEGQKNLERSQFYQPRQWSASTI
jgi:lipopolysaccharide transport system ATP-binding protein